MGKRGRVHQNEIGWDEPVFLTEPGHAEVPDLSGFKVRDRVSLVCSCGVQFSRTVDHLKRMLLVPGAGPVCCSRCKALSKSAVTLEFRVGQKYKGVEILAYQWSPTFTAREWGWGLRFLCSCGNEGLSRASRFRSRRDKSIYCSQKCVDYIDSKFGHSTVEGYLFSYFKFVSQQVGNRKKNKRDWSLTFEQWLKIVLKNCWYCSAAPDQIPLTGGTKDAQKSKMQNLKERGIYLTLVNSVDRYDNSIDYHYENCVPCCLACNFAKHTGTAEEYLARSLRVVNNFGKKQEALLIPQEIGITT